MQRAGIDLEGAPTQHQGKLQTKSSSNTRRRRAGSTTASDSGA